MASKTLLEIVQDALSAMDSDMVNSISDTEEALQVATIAKDCYYELILRNEWDFLKKLRELEPVSDSSKPNYLKIPKPVSEVHWFKYNVTKKNDRTTRWRDLIYKSPEDFVTLLLSRDNSREEVTTVTTFNGIELFVYTDRPPTYWTSFDDEYIVTDAFDSSVETTHQASKSLVYCTEEPKWEMKDNFKPDLPSKMFPLYEAEVRTACFFLLKQMENALDALRANRQNAIMIHAEHRTNARKKANFGRK